MSQTYTDNCFQSDHEAQTDLQNMEDNFAALKSSFSGTSAPGSPVSGMLWYDNNSGKRSLKMRDYAGSAWIACLLGDASQKIWVYRNAACEGYSIDSTVEDRVLALKGTGTGDAYDANGGTNAGSAWGTTHTHSAGSYAGSAHNHKWYEYNSSGDDQTYNVSAAYTYIAKKSKLINETHVRTYDGDSDTGMDDAWTSAQAVSITGTSGTDSGLMRPAAALGTMQYPNI